MNYLLFSSTKCTRHIGARGFSLVEVLVALLVIAFGLLGIAGMQAVSINNTGVAGLRSIAALQAGRMAAAMSANEAYWQQIGTSTLTTVVGSTITAPSDATLTGSAANCNLSTGGGQCPVASDMAAYDLKQWGIDLQNMLPGGSGKIACTTTGAVSGANVTTCTITITWVEKSLVQNQSSTVATTAGTTYDYEMAVQP